MSLTPRLDRLDQNYIINGDMRIAQRGTSFPAIANATYSLDRYRHSFSGAMVHTVSQDADVPTFLQSNYLFQNSLRLNLTTPDTSIAAGDTCIFQQRVEGYNWAHLAQKAFTLSFWVKATLAGVYCVSFRNSGTDRSYVAEYTINSTNTWEKKVIHVAASPSAGTWDYANGIGLNVSWALAAGTTFHTTAGAWQTGSFLATANQVNGVNTGATDFRITGVCINAGELEDPDFTLFGKTFADEVRACQRYYEKSYNLTTNPATNIINGMAFFASAVSANYGIYVPFAEPKRSDAGTFSFWDRAGNPSKLTTQTSGGVYADNITTSPSQALTFTQKAIWGNVAGQTTTFTSSGFHWAADAEL